MLRNQRRVQDARTFGSRNRCKVLSTYFSTYKCVDTQYLQYTLRIPLPIPIFREIGLIYSTISPTVIPLAGFFVELCCHVAV
ncbi:hypothetical protein GYMLUDRAFT_50624 [Collybiopsis luxurians FD-317 M1]|uniref:Uncharacterized protein n=1 Tax=Collybiopsis luxurians FD-317 M1 TaxID=944289 RepID=A0A0D0BP25_9AGAR|nr:hypothetical protein GYMLUDRAFT_50624 [Collybiopsis luxurians FD-317 M1]